MNYLVIISSLSLLFLGCTNFKRSIKSNKKDYILVTKHIHEIKCNKLANVKLEIIEKDSIKQIYFDSIFDDVIYINKYNCISNYDNTIKRLVITIPVYKHYRNNKKITLRFSNPDFYIDKTIPINEFFKLKGDTIKMELLPKFNCDNRDKLINSNKEIRNH